MTQRRWMSLLLAVVMVLTITGLAGAQRPAVNPDTVVLFTQQEPSCLQPMADACQMFVAELIRSLIFADVIGMTNEWKYFPVLAEKIPNLRDGDWKLNPNGTMTVTWRIKPGFTWHDGRPVTAEDWIWAYTVNMHPEYPSASRDVAERLASRPSAPNPRTIVVQWKKRYAFANLSVAGSGILPKHVTERLFRANPARFEQAWGTGVPTVGNGPFVLSEWQKGSSITVTANPKWRGVPPHLPAQQGVRRVTYRFISDTNTIVANVLSGAADAVDETAIPFVQGLELEQRLARENRRDFILRAEPGLIWEHIDMNLDNPHLSDKRVRQALLYAINREELVQQLFQGKQPVSHSFLPPKHYGYHPNVKKYAFDPSRARALLTEAGYAPGSDGIMAKGGQRLSLRFTTTAGNRTREQVQQILQAQWKAVGIEVRIVNQPARSYFGDTLPKRDFDLAMYAWVFSPTSDCEGLYTSDGIPGAGQAGGQNYPGYKNARVDELCHAVPEELDEGRRAQMLRQAQEIWVEDLPVLPLYFRSDYTGHKATLQNWLPTGSNTPVTWNAAAWRWRR